MSLESPRIDFQEPNNGLSVVVLRTLSETEEIGFYFFE